MNELEKFNQLLVKFMDPLINNKADLLSEIQPLFKQLLEQSEITYYCSECQENHFTGKKYQCHKKRSACSWQCRYQNHDIAWTEPSISKL